LAAPARGLVGPAVQEISVAQAHRFPVAAPRALPLRDAALPVLKAVRELGPGLRDAQRERRASELAALQMVFLQQELYGLLHQEPRRFSPLSEALAPQAEQPEFPRVAPVQPFGERCREEQFPVSALHAKVEA
jgi:hypothetical protein